MAFTKALYYPTIEIQDEQWLKSTVLYWDKIQTIVPESIQKPYKGRISKILHDEGILSPFLVKSTSAVVQNVSDTAMEYIQSNEAKELLLSKKQRSFSIHRDKMPRHFSIHQDKLPEEFRIHSEKMSYFLKQEFNDKLDRQGWVRASSHFAEFYMTLLANEICESKRFALLSDNTFTSNFAEKVRLDNNIVSSSSHDRFVERHRDAVHLAEGMLTNLIVQGVKFKPDTPIKKIIEFKSNHKDELGLFRKAVSDLVEKTPNNLTFDAMQQYVHDIYTNEFLPAYNNLGKSLTGAKLKWSWETFMKIAFFSVAGTYVLQQFGLSIPQALIAATGVSCVANKIIYNVDKAEKLRSNPYSYLILVDRNLNGRGLRDFARDSIV
jgi:hypothetical protein